MSARKEPETPKRRILLVDDHATLREGLAEVINRQLDLMACGQADNAERGIDSIQALKPDLVVVDISMEGRNGIELIKDIRVRFPRLRMLVLSMHDESVYAKRALAAGAHGYIRKQLPMREVLKAIRTILDGGNYVSAELATELARSARGGAGKMAGIESLTDRELEIFVLIGKGHRTNQIAGELHLSEKTIETHRANIRLKLNVLSGSELLQRAIQWAQSTGAG